MSDAVYGSTSLAAIGVAAHECGHAMQDAGDYAPLRMRAALVPVANIGAQLSWPLIIIGILLGGSPLISIGIILFSLAVLFQIVTLPVEYNASHRAVTLLDSTGILAGQEVGQTRKVLNAAALTYVAAAAASILQLLRRFPDGAGLLAFVVVTDAYDLIIGRKGNQEPCLLLSGFDTHCPC